MAGRTPTEVTDHGLGQALARGFITPTPEGVSFNWSLLPQDVPTPSGGTWATEALALFEQWVAEQRAQTRGLWAEGRGSKLTSSPTLRAAIQAAARAGIRTADQAVRFFGQDFEGGFRQKWITIAAIAAMVQDGYSNAEIRDELAAHGVHVTSGYVRARRHATVHDGPFGEVLS